MKGRQCCDDIKAQLDQVSDQIKQAEHAQHAEQRDSATAVAPVPSSSAARQLHDAKHGRSRSSSRSVSPAALDDLRDQESNKLAPNREKKRKRDDHESSGSDSDSGLRDKHHEKKRAGPPEARGSKKTAKELPVEKLPGSKQRKAKAGDRKADAEGRRTSPVAPEEEDQAKARSTKDQDKAVGGPKDLPQLKKKRHILYKQLQDSRQQVLL